MLLFLNVYIVYVSEQSIDNAISPTSLVTPYELTACMPDCVPRHGWFSNLVDPISGYRCARYGPLRRQIKPPQVADVEKGSGMNISMRYQR